MKPVLSNLEEVDDLVIGAGFSGLAAALRLAQFGRKVVVLEKHTLPGGLNSYYYRPGKQLYDSGLHVLTNRCPVSRRWGMPFVLRQLGFTSEQLPMHPPTAASLVRLGKVDMALPVAGEDFLEQIAADYPAEVDGWRALWALMRQDSLEPELAAQASRDVLGRYLKDTTLIDLLCLPVFLYGGYAAGDIRFLIFRNIFRSLFIEGVGHPGTIKHWLDSLQTHLTQAGGELYFRASVAAIEREAGRAVAVRLENGQRIRVKNVISSAGWAETERLLQPADFDPVESPVGISAVETTFCLSQEDAAKACPHPMLFFHAGERFDWDPVAQPFKSYSISCSAHFAYPEVPERCFFKIAAYLGGDRWLGLPEDDYRSQKEHARLRLEAELRALLGDVLTIPKGGTQETMTPQTVFRYTSHRDGVIYGGAEKHFGGETPLDNLHLVGNDQGGIGVAGAMISGIVVANLRILTRNQ